MSQKNSFISFLEQIALVNKNATEILTKMDQVVSSNKDSVIVNYQEADGRVSQFSLPTVNLLRAQLVETNANVQRLAGLTSDSSVVITDTGGSKIIKAVDLSREPKPVDNINLVSNFSQSNNWFFESLMNPLLTVNIDLSNQIDTSINKVLSRRYIIKFERDTQGVLTTNGLTSQQSFETTFLNKNNFTINDFLNWLNNPTNTGVLNKGDENLYKDEQVFDLNYKEVNNKGFFSVLKMEKDTLNNKMWYHLNTLTYYNRDGSSKTLGIGDVLAVTKKGSYTKYQVIEVNTSSSLFRVILERIEGFDPIYIGTSALEYYSQLTSSSTVKVSIGFDEYVVLFLKPINTDNNIISSTWSKGMAFYTNDLVLDTDSNVSMEDHYINSVYDYGTLLKDLVAKKTPSIFGSTPNKPVLLTDNFKVVQINKHLTDTKDFESLKKLHSQKTSSKSKLAQINESIIEKNKELNTKSYKSAAEKSASQNELDKLIKKQESETKLYSSYVNQITNSRADSATEAKFRIRGFWDIPAPIIKAGYKPQEVIGFEVQYRYGSKFGSENKTEGFNVKNNDVTTKGKTGYFSAWNPYKTDIRKRSYDEVSAQWIWEVEDISDADTPNINQLDVSIQRAEKVEIRIRAISEVGYPEAPMYSDWSDTVTVEFPDELNDVLGENEFILKEATQEEIRVQFENELGSKGVNKHVANSFYVNEQYAAHLDKEIFTSFKDSLGNALSLFDYLKTMNDKINALEETIKRAKGELKITLFKGTEEIEITNNATINMVINCEDYMIKTSGSTFNTKEFFNNVYMIQDYYLKFENISTDNPLGLLTDKIYEYSGKTDFQIPSINNEKNNVATFVDSVGKLQLQKSNQFIWVMNYDTDNSYLYSGNTSSGSDAPTVLSKNNVNLGGFYEGESILTTSYWQGLTTETRTFGASIHPAIVVDGLGNYNIVDNNTDNVHILNAQDSFKMPINIYFKAIMDSGDTAVIINSSSEVTLNKKLRFFIENENASRAFKFGINFNLIRHRKYALQNDYVK